MNFKYYHINTIEIRAEYTNALIILQQIESHNLT